MIVRLSLNEHNWLPSTTGTARMETPEGFAVKGTATLPGRSDGFGRPHRCQELRKMNPTGKENSKPLLNDTLKFPPEELGHGVQGPEVEFLPRPPTKPKPPRQQKLHRGFSMEGRVLSRKPQSSQESSSEPTDSESSCGSVCQESSVSSSLCHTVQGERGLLSNCVKIPSQGGRTGTAGDQQDRPALNSDSETNHPVLDRHLHRAKRRLSPVMPTRPLPPMEINLSCSALRTANRIDQDYVDYNRLSQSDLQSQHSLTNQESSLLDTTSVLSMKSTSSLLCRVRTEDLRRRSYLEGSLLASGALLGGEELERYFPDRRVGIFITTWNMQGRKELPDSLNDFLLPCDCDVTQDMYIIGIQESISDRREWEIRLQETLGPHYVLLYSASHGVLHLAVLIRRDLIWFCSEVEHATVTTRIVSQIRTKGAVGVSFTFFGTSFLFITSHFTSGEGKVYERILDYNKIVEALALPRLLPDTNPYKSDPSDVTTRFDVVFWFGDFNFRLNKERKVIDHLLRQDSNASVSGLMVYDQLTKKLQEGSIFKGFREGTVQFLPTYKFDIGCDVYDSSSKQRTPSYTDRVLYKCRHKDEVHMVKYGCCQTIKTSDHRPVYGCFKVKLRPGRDNIPLGAGQFEREIYLEGIKRRFSREMSKRSSRAQRNSAVCTVS
uniref:Phosphatidylinositol polyphosphate 5-phosphatase type IV n=1 Tax=Callorhinchus milii TaxID=7868 RepID=A0A4W3J9X5_CALMI|eukprot:gi/632969370/ref/XP_007901051.1/ PREDICTED: 72 kDa inositol polyphosphate 5-phosphatase [Callorhinchus milii]